MNIIYNQFESKRMSKRINFHKNDDKLAGHPFAERERASLLEDLRLSTVVGVPNKM